MPKIFSRTNVLEKEDFCLFVYFHEKVKHAQQAIQQLWRIELQCPFVWMSDLRTFVHVLGNTSPESTVICQIQINLIPMLCAVLSCCLDGVLGWGWALG